MELTHGYKKKTFSSILFAKKCKLHFTASLIKYFKHNNLPFLLVLYNIENLAGVIIFSNLIKLIYFSHIKENFVE